MGLVGHFMRDLSRRQVELFFMSAALIARHRSAELQPLTDDDVAEAAGALAATLETSARGIIYEHRPASRPAEKLGAELNAMLVEAGRKQGTSFERDAAAALRRIEDAVRETRDADPGNARAFLELAGRISRGGGDGSTSSEAGTTETPRLIVP
jgi:hypothetical protein